MSLENFLRVVSSTWSDSTIKAWSSTIGKYLKFSDGIVSREKISSWANSMIDLSPVTRSNYVKAVKSYASYLTEEKLLDLDEFEKIKTYSRKISVSSTPKSRSVSDAGVQQILRIIGSNVFLAHIFKAGYYLGLRAEEYGEIFLEDIVLDEGSHGIIAVRGKGKGKTKKQRILPLNREARRWLDSYLEYRKVNASVIAADTLFLSARHGSPSSRTVQKWYEEISSLSGMKVTPHDLRHTLAKQLQKNGVKPQAIQRYLGHASIQTTFKHYLHLDDDEYYSEF